MRLLLESVKYPTPEESLAEELLVRAAEQAGHSLTLVRPGLRPSPTAGYNSVLSLRPRRESTLQLELGRPNELLDLPRNPFSRRFLRIAHDILFLDLSDGRRTFYTQSKGLVASFDHSRLAPLQTTYGVDASSCIQPTPRIVLAKKLPKSTEERLMLRAQNRQKLHILEASLVLLQRADDEVRHGVDRTLYAVRNLPQDKRENLQLIIFAPQGLSGLENIRATMDRMGMDTLRQLHVVGKEFPLEELMLAADILMHPVRTDDHPYILPEAMATGLPLICTADCVFHQLVNAAGLPVIPSPFHNATLEDAFMLIQRELTHVTDDTVAAAQMLLGGNWADEAIAAATATPLAHQQEDAPLTRQEIVELVASHHRLCDGGKALRNIGKRAVTRVSIRRTGGYTVSYIVKEYRKTPWWHLRSQSRRTKKGTALMKSFTPACLAAYHSRANGSDYLIFGDCGRGSFHPPDYASRPDAAKLFAACGELLARLHAGGIFHKDAKAANYVANDYLQEECPYPVCLVDCDNVFALSAPLSMSLRAHNIAQFLASNGRLAAADQGLFFRMMGHFRVGYIQNSRMDREEATALWRMAWHEAHYGKHIERNLPEDIYLI